jgi:hypothetical protein
MPLWLLSNYRDLCESLRAEMNQNESRRPSAYNAGQFLLPPKNPLFTAARSNHLSPRLFYEPHYYLWLPHLFNQIPCPACKAAKRTNDNGSAVTLRLHGWPRAPRRVVDLDYTLYIVGYRYYCGLSACRKTYQSWAPAIMDVLPPAVAAQSIPPHISMRGDRSSDSTSAIMLSTWNWPNSICRDDPNTSYPSL